MINFYHLLKNNSLFDGVKSDLVNKVLQNQTIVTNYQNKQYIVQEEDLCDFIAFVLEGQVLIQKQFLHGDLLTINTLNKNTAFGGAILFASKNTFHYSVSSNDASSILFIKKKAINDLLQYDQVFSKNYVQFLSDRLFVFQKLVNILRLKDVRSKLVVYLLSERQKNNHDSFTISNSREEIANIIGVTRPSVSRELINMQKDGVIKINKRNVTLLKSDLWLLPPL